MNWLKMNENQLKKKGKISLSSETNAQLSKAEIRHYDEYKDKDFFLQNGAKLQKYIQITHDIFAVRFLIFCLARI